jgi:hypothetical protein
VVCRRWSSARPGAIRRSGSAGKIFASLPDEDTIVVKTTRAEQQALLAEDPDAFAAAPRVGRYGWVSARTERVAERQLRELVHQAWTRTAPKKLVADTAR